MSENEFVAKRVARMKRNEECTPVELLRYVLHEIETGEIQPDCMMIITAKREGSEWDVVRYRANLSREHGIAMLASEHWKAVRDWCT